MTYLTLINKYWLYTLALLLLTSCNTRGSTMNASDFFDKDTQALMTAVQKGRREQAEALLAQGVSFNRHGNEGITPLFYLIMKQDKDAMRLALELGADPNLAEPEGNTPVAIIAGGKDDELLQILLEGGGNPNSLDHNGYPAIFGAIGEERLEQIKLLIRHGADLNLTNKTKANPANYASNLNKYEIVYFLIEKGIDYSNRNSTDGTIAWNIHEGLTEGLLNPEYPAYKWALKVKQQLIDRGVAFPPPSPSEIRFAEGRPNKYDLEAQAEQQSQ